MNANVASFLEKNRAVVLEDFQALLRQPSISAKGQGIRECAALVEKFMQKAGIQTEIMELREGNPVLLGNVPSKKSKRTLMFYGHYDVQPIEPLEEWSSDAFAPKLTDGKIVARGASDSKNNVMALIKAVEAYLRTVGELPVNLKFLFEGEEEVSSPHLPDFVQANKDKLRADAVVCYDGGMDDSGRPGVDLGLKGILYVELRSQKAKVDLHSSRAPIVENPAWRLVWALNTLKGPDEKIKVDGWYEKVHEPTSAEMELLKKIPFDEQKQKSEMGVASLLLGRKGIDALQAYLFQPTCTICGVLSGHTSAGPKTVLPSKAMAKLDFRLVYDQNPDELLEKLKSHFRKNNFNDVEVAKIGSVEPSKTPADAPIARAVISAAKQVWGAEPVVFPNSPGSGPDYLFTKRLGLNSVWAGCASAFSNMHAPNEFELVDDFFKGIQFAGTIMENFAQV